MLIYFKDLLGLNFFSQNDKLGSLTDIFLNEHSWNINILKIRKNFTAMVEPVSFLYIPAEKVKLDESRKLHLQTGISLNAIREMQSKFVKKTTQELNYEPYEYFGLPTYWSSQEKLYSVYDSTEPEVFSHLQSLNEILGFKIVQLKKELGEVYDLLVDTDNWQVVEIVAEHKESLFRFRKFILKADQYFQIHRENSIIQIRDHI